MKILILGFAKLKYIPYMNFYLDNIDKGNEVHLLYWNRDQKPEDTSQYQWISLHEFSCNQKDEVAKLRKIKSFLAYRKFVLKTMRETKFDFIIVLLTLPGILVLDELKRHYSNRYIFDYRDSSYEGNPVFQKMVHTLVHHAKSTFVSSDAFRKYLPQNADIHTSHNILLDSLQHRNEKATYGEASDKIRIAFWGFIRHEALNREIIRKLSNDDRFELHYYGREEKTALNLKQYAAEIGATNIFFHGEYQPEDRYQFVRRTDLIHNLYRDTNTMLAMANKYYDGIVFNLPQLCMKGSYMGECCRTAGVGLECDPYDDGFADLIYQYYQQIQWNEFEKHCNSELERVMKEYQTGADIVYHF
ncbi:MAG: hypothetical protein RR224_12245 [Clostridia bacterium]